ncbi:hypothetical protein [Acinetobacter baumannii]|uniref:hypothetical protein n=1 Tax=Acinetobacter baumannii TaxID=470 RepID=UPI0010212E8C|nr:hypothetical protein [Acinetobacter baumannii]MDC4592545.1 hypothetical protein [Acinetobacter baumannii]RYL18410.1 hypothetical protein EWO64_19010 [Acinetobacter baumannii]
MLTVFIVLVALFVIALMVKTHNERNKAARLSRLSLKASEALVNASMHKMRLASMPPEEAFIKSLTSEEREVYLSLTTTLERLDFKVNRADEDIKKMAKHVQNLVSSLA